jgi:hypothetical protein
MDVNIAGAEGPRERDVEVPTRSARLAAANKPQRAATLDHDLSPIGRI